MSTEYTIVIIALYFGLLYLISRISTRKSNAATFFIANRNASWPLVAYGMIGVAISGITFISVPGQVIDMQFSYFQMVIGYSIGLILIAFIFVPIFYKIKAISIYAYLDQRFGFYSYRTGAIIFLFAQLATASFKLYLMAHVLQLILFGPLGMPFWVTVFVALLFIWLYTYKGGIKTVIFTDTLQTTFLILALIVCIFTISQQLDLSLGELYGAMEEEGISKVFFWSWDDPKNFFKLILVGILLTVMTNGIDQSVMQKHLTCKDLASSQKNIVALAVILLGVNALFLFLGGSLYVFSVNENIALPDHTDNLFPILAFDHLGITAATFFLVGIAAAAYSSVDSSLTGLTTSFCVDILKFKETDDHKTRQRQLIHLGFTFLIFVFILVFQKINNASVLSAFIRTSGLIYGPLLALYIFGIYSKRVIKDKLVPIICILSPAISIILDYKSEDWFSGYTFGYDILLANILIALIAMFLLSKQNK